MNAGFSGDIDKVLGKKAPTLEEAAGGGRGAFDEDELVGLPAGGLTTGL